MQCSSSNNFTVTREAVEAAYQKAQEANINVKGLIITNPSNPLGTTLDSQTLQSLVNFVNDKTIHLVCDEIYAATVFSSPEFVSIAEIIQEMDVNRDLIHIIYSLSKDMGLPGFRVGIVYSYNDVVLSCGRRMSSFGLVSSQTQYFLATLLSDDEFVDYFLRESSKRLARRHHKLTRGLEQVGIKCLKSNAGLFVWMDLRRLLEDPTSFDAEMKLWRTIVNDVKLNVSPGSSFHVAEPGWFRVCFANMEEETMDVALQRIQAFVCRAKEREAAAAATTNKKRGTMNLRLSFSSRNRVYEEQYYVMSPHMMSPRSPLVEART